MITLASRLRALDDRALHAILEVRAVAPGGIRDFFDLAEALLEPASIERALTRLDRPTLALLAAAGDMSNTVRRAADAAQPLTLAELTDRLRSLAQTESGPGTESETRVATLAGITSRAETLNDLMLGLADADSFAPYQAVTDELATWPSKGLPGVTELMSHPLPPGSAGVREGGTSRADQLATERAFSAVSSIAELISELSREPARELSRGGLGLPDAKRLGAVMTVDPDDVTALLAAAAQAGLISLGGSYWVQTDAGLDWLQCPSAQRWITLARAWHSALPAEVRSILARRPGVSWGTDLHSFATWLYPAGESWLTERVRDLARSAQLIGITAEDRESAAGAAVLSGDFDSAGAIMTAALPAEVGAVYLQHDLSIVSPGPLSPSIDSRLRGIADVESRELASSYRITVTSLNRAFAAGESAETVLAFLGSISLTGIPQPVDYLIHESAARYGLVRVGSGPEQNGTYVHSADSTLLGAIAVDQTLTSLGLVRDDDGLRSRFSTDVVFWALTDARYPVAAENSAQEIVHLRRHAVVSVPPAAQTSPIVTLSEKLRAGDSGEAGAASAWLTRQLDRAIKAKKTVVVSILMPGGEVTDYLLEPTSIGGGRFRARDRRADIERTLPIKSIVNIAPTP